MCDRFFDSVGNIRNFQVRSLWCSIQPCFHFPEDSSGMSEAFRRVDIGMTLVAINDGANPLLSNLGNRTGKMNRYKVATILNFPMR